MSLENTHDIGNVKIVMLAGGGGGAVALSDLTDVNILNPSNGQVLGFNSITGKWENMAGGGSGTSYAGLGIGKKKTVTNNIIDTDIDLHRAPIVGDRLLVWFDASVSSPTGIITYNNGVAVTSNVESVTPLNFGNGWNIFEFKNDGLLYDNCWVRKQNVPVPSTLAGMSDTAIVSPSDGQLLTFDNETQKWKNKTYVEANTGSPATELKKLKVGNVVYDTDGMKNYFVTNVANNNITVSVLNPEQFVQEVIAINTGAHTGSSNAWNLVLSGGMIPVSVALTKADGTAFDDDITANELLFIYVDTAGNTAKVLNIAGASGGTQEVYFDATATLSTSTTTTITFTESEITTSSVIDIAVSEWGLTPEDVTVTTGVCTVTMPKVSTARSVTVRIYVR